MKKFPVLRIAFPVLNGISGRYLIAWPVEDYMGFVDLGLLSGRGQVC